MIQYCRYCSNALDYNGEAEDFLCSADAECGDFGAGRFYDASKAKRPNKCKHFDFNPLDVFYTTYGEREYKPRTKTHCFPKEGTQIKWEELANRYGDKFKTKRR